MLRTKYRFKGSGFSKKLFFNILVSFMVLVFLLVASFFLIFSNIYKSTIYENITSESMSSLDRFNMEFDGIFSQLKQMNISISQNENINNFLYSPDYDYLVINRANNYLIQIKTMTSFLHSIVLYNRDLNFQIATGKPGVDVTRFADQKLRRPKSKSNMLLLYTSVGDKLPEKKTAAETLSVVFSNYFDINKPLSSAIISTLDRDEVQRKLLDRFEGSTFVTDSDGHIIFNSGSITEAEFSSYGSIINSVISRNAGKGSFTTKLKNNNEVVFFIKSAETDFYIINIRSYHNITNKFQTKRNILIVVSLIILFIFCTAVYIFTSKIYSPIRKVTEAFSNSKFGKAAGNLGEIDVISGVFNEALDHLQQLELKNVSNNQRLKEDSLRLLLKNGPTSGSLKRELNDYGLSVEFSNLIIACVRIDNYNRLKEGESLAYQTTLCRIIPEVLSDVFYCETINMFEGEVVLLVNFKNTSNNSFDLLLSEMDKLKELAFNTLQISITVGIGGIANGMEECTKAYSTALEMTKYRFTLGAGRTIYSKYLNENLSSNIYYPTELEDKLITSIKLNNKASFVEDLHSIVELLKEYPYSDAVSIMFQVISSCIKVINQLIREDSQKFFINFDEFSSIFSEMQTLDQIEIWLSGTYDQYQKTVEQIVQLKSDKHFKVVEKAQEYIKENFQDVNLSIEAVAETVGYAPYYFSKLFKEITGLSVNSYIRQVQINKAKEYLNQADIKITDIPGMIGFATINHFYFVFKKDVGLSPAAYREYVLDRK